MGGLEYAGWNMSGAGQDGQESAAERLFAGLRAGDARALGRTVSVVEDGAAEAAELLRLCRAAVSEGPRALRIGITGPAGAGKSTLVDGLSRELAGRGRRVGIVAVDPSSARTGGAVLGDRIRVQEGGAYMRSMATRGHLGGLARATEDVLTVIEASGRDVLLVETTGVGQGEIEVVGLADVVAVVLVPGMGDGVQALKAGVLEIGDVYVLNKADREGVERLEQEMRGVLGLGEGTRERPVLRTVATTGEGVAELAGVLVGFPSGAKAPAFQGKESGLPGLKPRPTARVQMLVAEKGAGKPREIARIPELPSGPVLDHLGIAVGSITEAAGVYRLLGAQVGEPEEIAAEKVRVAMVGLGESRIELLEATVAESAVGRFLAKRGPGLHHVALRVRGLDGVVKDLQEKGVRLVNERVRVGAGGHRYVFVHPSAAGGVLLELVEEVEG